MRNVSDSREFRKNSKFDHYNKDSYRKAVERAHERILRKIDEQAKKEETESTPWQVWTPYQIRHGRITDVELDFDLDTARAIAGHKKINTTMIYAHGDLKKAKVVALKNG
ncbi:MAG: hypothetical protein COA78_36895 [Blastopirellula sp.]|nr:MAG: hypothetical protein COA78_36895 [Blastopirellula sp.]